MSHNLAPRGGQVCAKEEVVRFLSTALLHPETRTQAFTRLTSPSELLFAFELDRNLHVFPMSIVPLYCLSHLTALQRATSQSIATDFVGDLHPTLEVEGAEAGGAA